MLIVLIYPTEMEVSDSELRNEICCTIEFFCHLGKITPETVKLMKEVTKTNIFASPEFVDGMKISKKKIWLQNWLLSMDEQKVL